MAWSETLLDAAYRDVPLQVMNENLQAQRSIAQHGTPYQDGDSAEDMGRGARVFNLRVVVYGDNYELELQHLLRALDTLGAGQLMHPIYGALQVIPQSWDVQHTAEHPDYAEVTLRFVEQLPDAPFFELNLEFVDTQGLALDDETRWQSGLYDLLGRLDTLIAEIQGWIGGGWVGLLERALGLPGIGLRLQQLRTQILGMVSGVAAMANSPRSAFDPLTDLARTPGEIRSAIQAERARRNAEVTTPLQSRVLVPATLPGGDALAAEASRAGTALLQASRQGGAIEAVPLPAAMPDDPVQTTSWGLVTLVLTELALANALSTGELLEAEGEQPTLSPTELEDQVNLGRALIQATIQLHRRLYDVEQALPVIEALRTVAALLQARARQVILLRPPLRKRVVESPASLRLLAHRWYGDQNRALELLRLNPWLRNPHNVAAGETLLAYAE